MNEGKQANADKVSSFELIEIFRYATCLHLFLSPPPPSPFLSPCLSPLPPDFPLFPPLTPLFFSFYLPFNLRNRYLKSKASVVLKAQSSYKNENNHQNTRKSPISCCCHRFALLVGVAAIHFDVSTKSVLNREHPHSTSIHPHTLRTFQ